MSFYFYGGDNKTKDAPITMNIKSNINAPMISPPNVLLFPQKNPIFDISLGPDYLFLLYENNSLYGYGNLHNFLGEVFSQLNINENHQISFNFTSKSTFSSILTGENFLSILTSDGSVIYAIKDQKVGFFQNKRYFISAIKGHSVLLFIDVHKNLLIYDQKTQKFFNISIPNVIDAASYRLNGRIVITVIDSSGIAYEYINDNEGDVLNDIEFIQVQFPQSFNIHFVESVYAKNESVFYVADAQAKNTSNSDYYVFAKGSNKFGMLGVGSKNDFINNLKQVRSNINQRNFKKISIGDSHSIFLTTKNNFFAFGNNESGQLLIENTDNPKCKVKLNNIWCGGNRTIFQIDSTNPYIQFINENDMTFNFPLDEDSLVKQKDIYISELESKLKNSNSIIDNMEKRLEQITTIFGQSFDDSDDENNENNNDEAVIDAVAENSDDIVDPLEDRKVKNYLDVLNNKKIGVVSRLIAKTRLVDYFANINSDPSKSEELQRIISKTDVMNSLYS